MTAPPVTAAPLTISTRLPGPLAMNVPELRTVPLTIDATVCGLKQRARTDRGRGHGRAADGDDLCPAAADGGAGVEAAGRHDHDTAF
jgi:hypothetical protein